MKSHFSWWHDPWRDEPADPVGPVDAIRGAVAEHFVGEMSGAHQAWLGGDGDLKVLVSDWYSRSVQMVYGVARAHSRLSGTDAQIDAFALEACSEINFLIGNLDEVAVERLKAHAFNGERVPKAVES